VRRLETVRRDFVANVSHELKTPLTVVGGFAETLLDDNLPAEQRHRFASTILTNTRRMQRIVDDLLDLSRIESGGWTPNPSVTDVEAAAADAVLTVNEKCRAKGITIRTEVSPEAKTVYADLTALRQILSNLVDNAVRHTNAGDIVVFSHREDGGVAIGVRDSGSGIPREALPRIFERFYRVDTARSREEGGTGLGLAIVRHLVEAHGGRVRADSTLGVGTTVEAWLPDSAERRA
jgi:two-component system, OmpR family, phosphate regulon sensor histidine kinase PhoR